MKRIPVKTPEMEDVQPNQLVERLRVGLALQISPVFQNDEDVSHGVTVQGWSVESFILTSFPDRKRGINPLRPGMEVTVRGIAGGVVFGFRTLILGIHFRPAAMMFLRFPGAVAAKEVRAHKRISTFILTSVTAKDGDSVLTDNGVIRDLGGRGCGIETALDLALGTEVALDFTLPNGKSLKNVAADVRNQHISMGRTVYGLQFLSYKSPDEIDTVKEFFSSISATKESDTAESDTAG